MFKALAILALALFVFPVQAYTQTNKAQQTSKSDKSAPSVAPVDPQHKDSPKLQPEAEKRIEADVRVVSTPAKDRYDKASVWINLALALVGTIGIIAAFITLQKLERQTKATEDAVREATASRTLAENTAKRQLRAYMVVRNSRLILHQDGSVEAKMELENCGQTPAYDLRGATYCRFTSYPIQKPKPMPDNLRQSQSTIGAGLAFHLLPPGGKHDGGDREHLIRKLSADGENLVYCANGYFTYKDIFQNPHWIKFQMIVGGPAGVRLDADNTQQWASFCNDSEGNEEDQQPTNPI